MLYVVKVRSLSPVIRLCYRIVKNLQEYSISNAGGLSMSRDEYIPTPEQAVLQRKAEMIDRRATKLIYPCLNPKNKSLVEKLRAQHHSIIDRLLQEIIHQPTLNQAKGGDYEV